MKNSKEQEIQWNLDQNTKLLYKNVSENIV